MGRITRTCLLFCLIHWVANACASEDMEAPRVAALLEQGRVAESGIRGYQRLSLALMFYCEAGILGSADGFYRVGVLLRKPGSVLHNPTLANAYLALASRLGHQRAEALHDAAVDNASLPDACGDFGDIMAKEPFDMEGYVSSLAPARRKIAALIRKQAPRYAVDARFGLAVAMAESNLNPLAVSSKNAQGVMQLIPDTQERFGVKKPFDAESSVRGGLSYLKWLSVRFDGDLALVAAAYNAGEGTVDKYRGIPPYPETQHYVRRVFYFAGIAQPDRSKLPPGYYTR